MATDQQNHLKSVVEQSQTLVSEINQLEGAAKSKREMLLKLLKIVSYSITNLQKEVFCQCYFIFFSSFFFSFREVSRPL